MHSPYRFLPLAALLLASPLGLRAQSASPASGWQKSLGLSVTPTWCYRALGSSDSDSSIDNLVSYRDDIESSRVGFDAAASLRLTHGEHLSLDAGLSFASRGFWVQGRPVNEQGVDPAYSPFIKSTYNYQFISLPVQATYAFGQGRLRGFVGGGLALDYLLGVQTEKTIEFQGEREVTSSQQTKGYRRANLTPRLTAGLRYALTPTYSLELAPVVQYSLLGSRLHDTVSEHLCSAGLSVGVYRQL
jgi:hypothetical protein